MAELKHDDVGAITSTPGYWPHRKPKPHAPPRIDDTQRANQRALRLAQTIESEIIPRLLLANSASQQKVFKGFRSHRITAGDVTALADTVVGDDLAGATAYVEDLLASGVALEVDLPRPAGTGRRQARPLLDRRHLHLCRRHDRHDPSTAAAADLQFRFRARHAALEPGPPRTPDPPEEHAAHVWHRHAGGLPPARRLGCGAG